MAATAETLIQIPTPSRLGVKSPTVSAYGFKLPVRHFREEPAPGLNGGGSPEPAPHLMRGFSGGSGFPLARE